jgi:hypothetical protein
MANGLLTGTSMVKTKFIEKRIVELTDGYLVTDQIFAKDTTDALSIKYEQNTDPVSAENDVEERNEQGMYPRIGMSTDEKQAMIKDYGLGIELSYEAVTKNQISSIDRAYIKLGNSLVKFVDTLGLKKLTDNYNMSSTTINTLTAAVPWATTATSKPFNDILLAAAPVNNHQNGYVANVAVFNPVDLTNALLNETFRKEMDTDLAPSEKILRQGVVKGKVAGVLLVESRNIQQGYGWVGQSDMVGTRHQAQDGFEYDSYRLNQSKKAPYVVDGFKEFVDVLNEPKAGTLLKIS